MALTVVDIAIILAAAFIPAIMYLIWIRAAEINLREPFFAVEGIFLYGATVAIGLAYILEVIVVVVMQSVLGPDTTDTGTIAILLALVFAPFIEEFTKATGVLVVGKRLIEPENGLVYGAACGLGFAASENVLYFSAALLGGVELFIVTAVARTLTSTLLHTSTTSITGYGITRSRCFKTWLAQPRSWIPYYLLAVAIHSGFNFLALLGLLSVNYSDLLSLIGLMLSFVLVFTTITIIRRKIQQLDRNYRPGQIQCE